MINNNTFRLSRGTHHTSYATMRYHIVIVLLSSINIGGSFYVPPANLYELTNLGDRPIQLTFTLLTAAAPDKPSTAAATATATNDDVDDDAAVA
jgi:septal ring-binding cell division protein DamX